MVKAYLNFHIIYKFLQIDLIVLHLLVFLLNQLIDWNIRGIIVNVIRIKISNKLLMANNRRKFT